MFRKRNKILLLLVYVHPLYVRRGGVGVGGVGVSSYKESIYLLGGFKTALLTSRDVTACDDKID